MIDLHVVDTGRPITLRASGIVGLLLFLQLPPQLKPQLPSAGYQLKLSLVCPLWWFDQLAGFVEQPQFIAQTLAAEFDRLRLHVDTDPSPL